MLKSSTFPPYAVFTPIMSCTAQAASRRPPPNTQEMLARVKNVQSRGFPWYIALQGGGKALLDHALTWARSQGYRQMIAVVGDCANVASVALHLRSGFTEIGTLKDIGFKHGRWLDTVLLQCQLGKGSCTLPDSPVPGR